MEPPNPLNFKGNNPGSVQYGNFINYYQFHPPGHRLKLLPTDIWGENDPFYALDLGCNSGDLAISVHNFLMQNVTKDAFILGVDIDPVLIERCKEKNTNKNINFYCLDIMEDNNRQQEITDYLKRNKINKFSAVFCFSITMWIHLNHGDEGLKSFLQAVCRLGDLIIIEPQPWRCYKTAVKRMKLCKAEFPLFRELKIRDTVEAEIEEFLVEKCGVQKIKETPRTEWNRKLLFFKHCNGFKSKDS